MAIIEIKVGTSASSVNSIIAAAADGDVIQFEAGTHIFTETIIIRRDDISVVGAGEAETQIKFRFDANGDGTVGAGEGGSGFAILGFSEASNYVRKADRGEATDIIHPGDKVVQLADTTNLAVGDTIHLSQINTEAYLEALGGCEEGTACHDTALNRSFREFITTITELDEQSNTITLADGIPYAMDPAETPIVVTELTDIRKNVSLSDLSIEFEIFDPDSGNKISADPNVFSNTQAGFFESDLPNNAAVYVEGSRGANLENLSVLNAPSQGFAVRNSINLTAENLSVDGSFNKGAGGNGYGLDIYETFNSTFSDLELFDVRHAVVFSAWNAEVGNVVDIENTNRDINFHGGPDMDNDVTVENATLEYGHSAEIWKIVSNGGRLVHQQTDIYGLGNSAVFEHASGSERDEFIYASDNGATLFGNGGDDSLFAGAGADLLDGGAGFDDVSYLTSQTRVLVDLRGGIENQFGAEGDVLNSIERLIGSSFNDILLGDDNSNRLVGRGGDDIIYGRLGDDIIKGSNGDDQLHGQRGNDRLIGGNGDDVFFFDDGTGRDRVFDFEDGADRLDFSRVGSVNDIDDLTIIERGSTRTDVLFVDEAGDVNRVLVTSTNPLELTVDDFNFA